ncbi:hypothetical protein PanWU01x14_014630 [Parasponia andersonii]|uniref:Uncharacterized protein n=1 Tax=Parasponia andersonii TaxID=3476 RepID=A0A2P5E092_PARAD|nr:hypothetical protein PanWU01x14_014630 [Parasponia andersonii]
MELGSRNSVEVRRRQEPELMSLAMAMSEADGFGGEVRHAACEEARTAISGVVACETPGKCGATIQGYK